MTKGYYNRFEPKSKISKKAWKYFSDKFVREGKRPIDVMMYDPKQKAWKARPWPACAGIPHIDVESLPWEYVATSELK